MSAPGRRLITNTSREALLLYRDILRATRKFTWTNEKGELWRDVLARAARQEYEQCRHETDPEIIMRMILTGRDALQQIEQKFYEQQMKLYGHTPKDK